MALQPKRFVALTAVALAAGGLAACGNSSGGGGSSSSGGTPVSGGTLHIVAAAGPDHIDTVPAYYTADYMLERAYSRQMLSYPASPALSTTSTAWTKATTPVADVATVVPTAANGGITNGGKTYTFHIRQGVNWSSTPVRQVTGTDFIREFKAMCNPAPGGFVGNIDYFEATVSGLTAYCDAEQAAFKTGTPTAASVASFQNSHTISGLSAPDPLTLKVTLTQPASDFLNIMAMPFASARPAEYDQYLPNSLQLDQHTLSDGPYKITSYLPGKSISLARNTAWKQSTDPIRHQYVQNIQVTEGVTSAQTQLTDMEAGSQDLPMDTSINPSSIPGLQAKNLANFKIWAWTDVFPYVVFNTRSPNSGGAAGKLLVRQAVEYGIDKGAVQKVYGGPAVTTQIHSAIPPGNVGTLASNPYPSGSGGGSNVAMCKQDLKKAGYANGVTLTYLYANDSVNTAAFTAIQASLKPCGITLNGKAEPGSSFFTDLGNSPVNAKAGTWDLGQPGWIPDWFGNNGRTIIPPMFQTDCQVNTINYGCYTSNQMDSLIKQAEAATSVPAAGQLWGQANTLAMQQALIVPIQSQKFPMYTSSRIHGPGAFQPLIGDPDVTNLWISGS